MDYSAYRAILLLWISIAVLVFFVSLFITAPYGRHSKSSWGLRINNRLAWIVMEGTVLVVFTVVMAINHFNISGISWFFITCFFVHYVHRSFIFPFRIKNKNAQMPAIIMISAIVFNVVNGWALSYFFTHYASYDRSWIFDPRFLIGLVLFVAGMSINISSDSRLIQLRKKNENDYSIPFGNLFELISCPNHFGEIVEWLGYALMCWNLPAFTFFIWTAANLIPRSLAHHTWYRSHFQNYPSNRKAVIPFLM